MHNPPGTAATACLWLIAGTGEGPVLVNRLLDRGWRIQVSVVSAAAALAYRPHPHLDLRVGAIEAKAGVSKEVARSRQQSGGFRWVIDASHPFAAQISLAVNKACQAAGQPLLRLHRPPLPTGNARLLRGLSDLPHCELEGALLLMAIGSRRMAEAMASTPDALHHARILPHALALQQAMAAGLPPERVACLRPGGGMAIERALCRRWGITTVLCRQSGGVTEGGWSSICSELGLRLLLLERPAEPMATPTLTMEQLLDRVGWP